MMLQLQSSRNKVPHVWKKQKEPNFLQRNKLALKQKTKLTPLKSPAANKRLVSKETTSKRPNAMKPSTSGVAKSTSYNDHQQQPAIGKDSVVISKTALDELLKQLADAKQTASILPPIGNTHNAVINSAHKNENTHFEEEVVTVKSHPELPKQQHAVQKNDLDHSDAPRLSLSNSLERKKRSMNDVDEVYFPFGRPGGGAPNKPIHSSSNANAPLTTQTSPARNRQVGHEATGQQVALNGTNSSPRQHYSEDVSPTNAKTVYLEEWQIKERMCKRQQNLEHFEHVKAQIAERERQKEELRQRKALEEKQEEERIAKQRERLKREYQEEQERIRRKEEELVRRNALLYKKIQEAESSAIEVKQKCKVSPHMTHTNNIRVPAIFEEQYSDYESGTDDPDSRTNLDQVKVRLSFDSALRSPSMCNVAPDNGGQGQEQSSSPRKQRVKSKFNVRPAKQHENVDARDPEAHKQRRPKHHSPNKGISVTSSQSEVTIAENKVGKRRERKPSKIPVSTKELLKNHEGSYKTVSSDIQQLKVKKTERHDKDISSSTQNRHSRMPKATSTKVNALALQTKQDHIRSDSPPVPALAKKLTVSSTASASSQSTDHSIPSQPPPRTTVLSKKAQQKKLNSTKEQAVIPMANSVARLHQASIASRDEPVNQYRSDSPPVPAVAKKLQAQLDRQPSLVEFDSHSRPILPAITSQSSDTQTNVKEMPSVVTSQSHTSHKPQLVLPPVGCHGHPSVTELQSHSPPVPALAKRLSQRLSLNTEDHMSSHVILAGDQKRLTSPELKSDSRFTYLPTRDGILSQASDHHGMQTAQPIIYVPVSPQYSTVYPQCSVGSPVYFQNPQQAYCFTPQVVSPVQLMVPPFSLSPPQSFHQQADTENKARVHSEEAFGGERNPQLINTEHQPVKPLRTSTQDQGNTAVGSDTHLHLPSIAAAVLEHKGNEENHRTIEQSSFLATPQLSQQREAVLQHLAIMKKRLLAQQQSITKRQSSSSFKLVQQPNNKLPPLP